MIKKKKRIFIILISINYFLISLVLSFKEKILVMVSLENLYHALHQSGINTSIDDEVIKRGEQISPTIFKAIEKSRMAIIVFSKTYFPVFYNVDPSEIRNQMGLVDNNWLSIRRK
ncbi:disease resistance protein (TIR-NBS-LRR class) [Medicago truncatula]|uniref:Disease resistance protein (TIR-NBS-LRR class) n=1 Tax=Medicago truncatula TaxID=3880 RepID=G7KYY2_MEDTR|nr:disease resistance protein (TIR-NBS-LRR class) [Medicago truncatula]